MVVMVLMQGLALPVEYLVLQVGPVLPVPQTDRVFSSVVLMYPVCLVQVHHLEHLLAHMFPIHHVALTLLHLVVLLQLYQELLV